MPVGYFSLILHAHLPFVRHPEYPEFLEEDWLYEAITEVYLPLIFIFQNLHDADAKPRLAMNVSPPLCEMLADPLLQERYTRHIENLLELARKELHRVQKEAPDFIEAAEMYVNNLSASLDLWNNRYGRNLINAFRELQDEGVLEIITCCATHGFLPLISTVEARRAQIAIAVTNYKKHFGRQPRGIWLAECAYEPGIEDFLKEYEIEYLEHDEEQIRSYIEIGNLYLRAERKDRAIETFSKAQDLTEVLDNVHRDAFFGGISVGFLIAGSQDLSDRALDLVADKTQIANALFGHARHFWQSEQKEDAFEALDEAYDVLRSQKDTETRNSRERYALFGSIAAQFAGFGKGERGIEIAERIEDDEYSMTALTQVAQVLMQQDSQELARQALSAIADEGQRVFALIEMSDAAKREGRTEQAVELLNEAAAHTEDIPQLSLRANALNGIADRAASTEQDDLLESSVEQLFKTISQMKGRLLQSKALVLMAALVKKHELELSESEFERLRGIISTAT
ncbi:hypothetical protein [Leptolyngbya sp. 7M]|uniref:hypothetical protein n=1 Tax=Leptolyngbya sp. 7M TaxID=2812896 RepID=UPI001B8B2899|nr:hypothetical protein [Leptolyngbya sp. 7M]QYO67599.1 hypothetical protein JVX88_12855 [Leptolyngbya sp. 7M]